MYWEKRLNRQGKSYYSFIYWDVVRKQNVRLRQNEVPQNITSDAEAEQFCQLREAEAESAKMRIEKIGLAEKVL